MFRRGLAATRFCSQRVRLEYVDEGKIARVTLCRGDKLNVMDRAFFKEVREAFKEIDLNEEARVAVVGAEGKHFCAGLDLKDAAELFFKDAGNVQRAKVAGATLLGLDASITEKGMPAMRNQFLHKLINQFQDSVSTLQLCRVPVIAAVHGKCIGGGVDLVTSADVRLCTEDATFSIKEAEVGIVADLGTLQRIGGIVGQGIARELAFTSWDVKAERAERIGLVSSTHKSREELENAAMAMARRIASSSPLAVQGTKEALNHLVAPAVADGLKHAALHNAAFLKSDDLLAAVLAFAQKKPASFSNHVLPTKPL